MCPDSVEMPHQPPKTDPLSRVNRTRKRGRDKEPEREFEELVDEQARRHEQDEESEERKKPAVEEDPPKRPPGKNLVRGKRLDLLV